MEPILDVWRLSVWTSCCNNAAWDKIFKSNPSNNGNCDVILCTNIIRIDWIHWAIWYAKVARPQVVHLDHLSIYYGQVSLQPLRYSYTQYIPLELESFNFQKFSRYICGHVRIYIYKHIYIYSYIQSFNITIPIYIFIHMCN